MYIRVFPVRIKSALEPIGTLQDAKRASDEETRGRE